MGDLVSGLSVAGLLLPEAVAYSAIAGLTPGHAIFAAVLGLIVYAIVGQSRFAIIAPTSSSAAILAAAVASFPNADASERLALAFGLVLVTGFVFIVCGLARLGSLADFIARPVLRGFAFGLAVTIVIKQLPLIAGVSARGDPFQILISLGAQAGAWNLVSLLVGSSALALLLVFRTFPALPGPFVVLTIGIVTSLTTGLCGGSTACVGSIDIQLLTPGLPSVSLENWSRLAQLAVPMTLIVYAESWGSMRTYALRRGGTLDANRELVALGLANIASGLMRGMAVGAGFSATSANEAAGARSRWSGAIAALAIIILVALGQQYIAKLPEAVLAAVVIAALAHALDPRPLVQLWRLDRDQYVALTTAVSVLIFGVLNGMLIAVAFSLVAVLQRFSRPIIATLGRLDGGRDFVDIERHPQATTDPGIGVYRPAAPIFFVNCERIFRQVECEIAKSPGMVRAILSVEESDDFDSTTLEALIEFDTRLSKAGHVLYLARVKDQARELLSRSGASQLASSERCFWSVADAVDAARAAD